MVPHALGDHQVMDLGWKQLECLEYLRTMVSWTTSAISGMPPQFQKWKWEVSKIEQDWARLSKNMREPSMDVTTNWRFAWNKSKLRLHAKLLRSCVAFLTPGLPQSERVWLSRAGQWHKNRVYKWINGYKSHKSNGSAFDESTAWLRFAGRNR